MPPVLSQAHITPIFKKDDATDPAILSIRRLLLWHALCVNSKLIDIIIKDQLLSYLLGKYLISKHQHVFILKHSTTTNLLECLHDWSAALNKSNSVDISYTDFRCEFDSILFIKLLYKLQCYGVRGRQLGWISVFNTGCSQSVVADNVHSTYIDVISGVPEGSVLVPFYLSYLLMIMTLILYVIPALNWSFMRMTWSFIMLSNLSALSVIVTFVGLLKTFVTGLTHGSSL